MIGPKGEKVCLISCSENNDQRGNVRSDNLHGIITGADVHVITRQPRADAATVHSAVTGAGLVNNVIKT